MTAQPFMPKYATTYQAHAKRIKKMIEEGLHDKIKWKPEAHQRYLELEEVDEAERIASLVPVVEKTTQELEEEIKQLKENLQKAKEIIEGYQKAIKEYREKVRQIL